MARVVLWATIAVAVGDVALFAVASGHGESGPFGVIGVGVGLLGVLIVRRAGNPIGWFFLVAGFGLTLSSLAESFVHYNLLGRSEPLPGTGFAGLASTLGQALMAAPLPLLFLLFPTGRVPTPRWRPVVWVWAVAVGSVLAALALRPGKVYATPAEQGDIDVPNPIGVPALEPVLGPLIQAAFVALVLVAIASVVSLVIRFRGSDGEERQQMKWLVFVAALIGVLFVVLVPIEIAKGEGPGGLDTISGFVFGTLAFLFIVGIPGAIAVAVLRYRLYDIDLVINRTLVYGSMAVFITAVYIAVVVGIGAFFGRGDEPNLALSILATAVVAVAFQPIRSRVQHAVNQMLYGDRDEPYAALSRLGRSLEASIPPGEVLGQITQTVAQALRVPFASIELMSDGAPEQAVSHGEPVPNPLELPLVHRGEMVGRLVVGPRRGTSAFSATDRRLLDDLARHAGVAAHAYQLTRDLQRSRERLVVAREEERRRLRRNLHDGLGPTLAGMAMELETVRSLVREDDETDAHLVRLKEQAQGAITDIRRIVYDLRPPALDQLGLVGALREDGARFATDGLLITIDAPDDLPPLPAATEVAAYRIALEGIANAARHSGAKTCRVRLSLDGGLVLEVSDDGRGFPSDLHRGVGLSSMHERASELGGTLSIERVDPGGTKIVAHLPLAAP